MTADEARKIAVEAREANIVDLERDAMVIVLEKIADVARSGNNRLEVAVPKEYDNSIRLRLCALGYKAEWGQMTANVTFIRVYFE